MARPTKSMLRLFESAEIRLPTINTTLADINIGFRPNMSLIFPQNGIEVPLASRYAEPIQANPESEAWKLEAIVGSAVVRIVVSRAAKKVAMHIEVMICKIL